MFFFQNSKLTKSLTDSSHHKYCISTHNKIIFVSYNQNAGCVIDEEVVSVQHTIILMKIMYLLSIVVARVQWLYPQGENNFFGINLEG